jgi:integral membrane protein (TIGR01906 family)
MRRRGFLPKLARYAGLGGGVTLGLAALIGFGGLVAFNRLFLAFHQVSFSNDFWLLDPRKDFLIMMFPEGFFLDATMWIAGSTIVEAVLLAALPVALFWWRPRVARRAAQRLAT